MNRLLIQIGEYLEDSDIELFVDLPHSGNKELDNKLLQHLTNSVNEFFTINKTTGER